MTPEGASRWKDVDVAAAAAAVQAVEWERARMASVLHDGPVQELTAALLFLDGATQGPAPDADLLRRGMETLQRAVGSCRRLMDRLTPDVRDADDFASRVRDFVVDCTSASAAAVVDVDLSAGCDGGHRDVLYTALRILQELIDDVARQANGELAGVSVTEQDGWVVLRVADGRRGARVEDGPGMSGLDLARQRAHACGGELTVDSGADGTVVHARLPVAGP